MALYVPRLPNGPTYNSGRPGKDPTGHTVLSPRGCQLASHSVRERDSSLCRQFFAWNLRSEFYDL